MRESAHPPDDHRSEYDRFADLARRILTTPKRTPKKTTKMRTKKRK